MKNKNSILSINSEDKNSLKDIGNGIKVKIRKDDFLNDENHF